MTNEDGSLWLVFNGEVYNHDELRNELVARGHRFRSRTDSEVILHAYEEWGEDCVRRFNGMWGFALWDARRQLLFCSRDHFGIKPFYYSLNDRELRFASEIKAVLVGGDQPPGANTQMIYDYLISGYLDHSRATFFTGIEQLPPAHNLVVTATNAVLTRYWQLDPNAEGSIASPEEAAEGVRYLLGDSVRLRMVSDVPIGTCLSGGLDSSSIVSIMNNVARTQGNGPVQTFSAFFDQKGYDERPWVDQVVQATGAEPHFVTFDASDMMNVLPKVIWHQEEPFNSTSIIAQWYVMKLARQNGTLVILDGQGADELFAGYHRYFAAHLADLFAAGRFGEVWTEMGSLRAEHGYSLRRLGRDLGYGLVPTAVRNRLSGLNPASGGRWLGQELREAVSRTQPPELFRGRLNNMLYQGLTFSGLPSFLRYEDRNSMAFSIESRLPFLDPRLVEYSFKLDNPLRIARGVTKQVLREAMTSVLPNPVRMRMDKMGFVTPEDVWFRTTLKDFVGDLITSSAFRSRGYFDATRVEQEFQRHVRGEQNISREIWRWVNLELWARTFLDRPLTTGATLSGEV